MKTLFEQEARECLRLFEIARRSGATAFGDIRSFAHGCWQVAAGKHRWPQHSFEKFLALVTEIKNAPAAGTVEGEMTRKGATL